MKVRNERMVGTLAICVLFILMFVYAFLKEKEIVDGELKECRLELTTLTTLTDSLDLFERWPFCERVMED